MSCIQCGCEQSKYKCPKCSQPYCTVACCKKHKETPCEAPVKPMPIEPDVKVEYEFPTDDTVPQEKLKLLEESKDLKLCLANPHVREILKVLDSSPHPDSLFQKYMQEPIFTEFVDACLKVVQPPEEDEHR